MTSYIMEVVVSEKRYWYQNVWFCLLVCGLKKNKRPKEDPSSSGNRVRRSPAKKKQIRKHKSKKTGRVKKVINNKKKQRKSKNKNKIKKSSRTNSKQIVDESDKRVPLIWPWLASVTINGEVSCSAHIISPRFVICWLQCSTLGKMIIFWEILSLTVYWNCQAICLIYCVYEIINSKHQPIIS